MTGTLSHDGKASQRQRTSQHAAKSLQTSDIELRPTDSLRLHPQAGLVPEMGKERFASFRTDVADRGITVPIEIDRAGVVLDGRERLRAALEVGLAEVPARVVDPADPVSYMLLAALERRDLDASQRAALVLVAGGYREARAAAAVRSRANLRNTPSADSVEVATLPPRHGLVRNQLAKAAAVGARTAQDVLTVYEHDQALFARVLQGTLPAHRGAKQIRQRQRYAEIKQAPPIPEGPFDLIYADPPWQMGNAGSDYAPEQYYPTLSLEDIKALPVPAAENAVLFLWAVNSMLPEALEVIEAWGFTLTSQMVWVKPSIKMGVYFRNRHELLLFARKGNYPVPEPPDRVDSVIAADAGRHSQKPDVVYSLIEKSYPLATKLELFRRGEPWPGWQAWGNQVT